MHTQRQHGTMERRADFAVLHRCAECGCRGSGIGCCSACQSVCRLAAGYQAAAVVSEASSYRCTCEASAGRPQVLTAKARYPYCLLQRCGEWRSGCCLATGSKVSSGCVHTVHARSRFVLGYHMLTPAARRVAVAAIEWPFDCLTSRALPCIHTTQAPS